MEISAALCRSYPQVGAPAGMNYEQMARRVAASTGGIGCAPGFGTHVSNENHSLRSMRFQLKTLDDQMVPALSALHDLLFSLDPRDSERLRDVLVQSRGSVSHGHGA